MITQHMQKQMLRLYRLVCGKDYAPDRSNVDELHRRMQSICYLSTLLFFFPDCSFSLNYRPNSPRIELALRLMDRYENIGKMNENNRSVSPSAELDVHEMLISPLFRGMDFKEEDLTEYLELAASLCYTADKLLPGANAKQIVESVMGDRDWTFSSAQAEELLHRFHIAKLIRIWG